MNRRTANIYALVDDFEDIKYIGSTGMAPQQRSAVHHRHRNVDEGRGNPRLNAWLRSMERPPKAILLQQVVWQDRIKAETNWTRWARKTHGNVLLNVLDGATPTPDEMARRRANKIGHYKPHTPEAKKRISEGRRRAWEQRKQIDAWEKQYEQETGYKVFRIPRSTAELRQQLLEATDDLLERTAA